MTADYSLQVLLFARNLILLPSCFQNLRDGNAVPSSLAVLRWVIKAFPAVPAAAGAAAAAPVTSTPSTETKSETPEPS